VTPDACRACTRRSALPIKTVVAIWAVEGALLLGILLVVATAFGRIKRRFADGSKAAVGGALLAAMNTASEYGFGGVIAALPGFMWSRRAEKHSQSAGQRGRVGQLAGRHHRLGLGRHEHRAGGDVGPFIKGAQAAHIPLEVLHRVVAMASGGMDTLPHNGAVITLLAVTGLTHKESYREIFAITSSRRGGVLCDRGLLSDRAGVSGCGYCRWQLVQKKLRRWVLPRCPLWKGTSQRGQVFLVCASQCCFST
jgi:hypothetical protein